jgi:hypothetical protein
MTTSPDLVAVKITSASPTSKPSHARTKHTKPSHRHTKPTHPSAHATATPSPTQETPTTTQATSTAQATATLCLSIARSSGKVKSGQPATFTVRVWINDWTPAGTVTISLYTVTAGQHATFTTSGCHERSSCTIPAPGKTPVTLHAQVTAKHSTTSITVKAVGEASAAKLSQPLAVSESVRLTVPTPNTEPTPAGEATPTPIEPVPLPTLSAMSHRTLMSPGNASGLFPSIVPSPTATPSPVTESPTPTKARTAQAVEVLPLGMTTGTAQVIGIVAVVMAICVAALAKLLPGRRTK